jgi:hypothetical protein
LFQRFSEYEVLLNQAKCFFGATEVTFLGYTVAADGTRPLMEKVAAKIVSNSLPWLKTSDVSLA